MATKAELLAAISGELPKLDVATDQLIGLASGGEQEPSDRRQARTAREHYDALFGLSDDSLKADIESAMNDAIGQFESGAAANINEYLRGKTRQHFPMSSGTGDTDGDEYQRLAGVFSGIATNLKTAVDS